MVERTIAGMRRLFGEKDKRERRSIARDVLIELVNTLNGNTLDGATLHAAYCAAFAAFLDAASLYTRELRPILLTRIKIRHLWSGN